MRSRLSPLPTALLAAAFAGCFADSGSETSGKTSGATASSSAGETETSSVSASSTSSAGDPTGATQTTTSASSTTNSTTTSSTSATDPTTSPATTDPSQCPGECVPGEVEIGGACGSCGLVERTCSATCAWGDGVCVDHPETCALWHLPAGTKEWTHSPLAAGVHAPTGTIVAAFEILIRKEAYVLTGSSYHILDLTTREWTWSGSLTDFPNLGGALIHAAYTVNDGQGGNMPTGNDGVTILTSTAVYLYDIAHADQSIVFVDSAPCCDDAWTTPESPKIGDVRAFWLDLENTEKWLDIPVGACGNLSPDSSITWYGAAITADSVHTQEIGNCFEFKDKRPFSEYPPFTFAGAPTSAAKIVGAFYADGLWILQDPK